MNRRPTPALASALLFLTLASAATAGTDAPRRADAERYFEMYRRGELKALYEAASAEYRRRSCRNDPYQCPHIDGVDNPGRRVDESFSCGRDSCTYTATIDYERPPDFPGIEGDVYEWRVTVDKQGRYEGTSVMQPDALKTATIETVGGILLYVCPLAALLFFVIFGAIWLGSRDTDTP